MNNYSHSYSLWADRDFYLGRARGNLPGMCADLRRATQIATGRWREVEIWIQKKPTEYCQFGRLL